jgi:DNA repair photolyase
MYTKITRNILARSNQNLSSPRKTTKPDALIKMDRLTGPQSRGAMQSPPFRILHVDAKSILSSTSGFIAQSGFTHSLNPARNCTFGCTYCYVPTMRVQAGLKPEDWQHWGQFTTFKENSPELLLRELRAGQVIYCSPLVDPYQPAERTERLMPRLLAVLLKRHPRTFVIQTRGVLILRDLELLKQLSQLFTLRVSFS